MLLSRFAEERDLLDWCFIWFLRLDSSGVPNDGFEENPPYSVLNITRVSLRQSCLIFNFPGKKYPLFTASKRDFEVNGLPASARL